MTRVFMSVLGTNDYLSCNYYHQNDRINEVRFVQEATIRMFCSKWSSDDRIVIFTTEKAYQANWLDNGHKAVDGCKLERIGLQRRLDGVGLKCPVVNIRIPEGRTEAELWQLFGIIQKEIPHNGEVTFDITHSFRSIPMLALTALNYAKTTKEIAIGGIYYGALEALGEIGEVKRLPIEDRSVPVFDLIVFDQLLEWAIAVDRFVSSGDARHLGNLAQKSVRYVLTETKGQEHAAASVRRLAKNLTKFTEIVATCRGPEIQQIGSALSQSLSDYRPSRHAAAFDPLVSRIREHMHQFRGDHVNDGLKAAIWCLEHNLIQQGFTILQETVVSSIVLSTGLPIKEKKARDVVTGAAWSIKKAKQDNEKDLKNPYFQRVKGFLKQYPKWVGPICKLSDYRNDLNHAGWRDHPKGPMKLRNGLETLIKNIEENLIEKGTSL